MTFRKELAKMIATICIEARKIPLDKSVQNNQSAKAEHDDSLHLTLKHITGLSPLKLLDICVKVDL